jgi:hypothetical protein
MVAGSNPVSDTIFKYSCINSSNLIFINMALKHTPLNRRTFLRGLGATISLPMFEAMNPIYAKPINKSPLRVGYIFVPNGMHMPNWTPSTTGARFDLPYILEPFKSLKKDILILSGLTQDKGRANGDGPGDHARSAASFLTGVQPVKSEGSNIRVGISADQYVAEYLKNETRFSSLEIGVEGGRQAGKCDSGYSCAYSNNISWKNESTPMSKETNPRLVFERLFGKNDIKNESFLRRKSLKKSILDFVMEDANNLHSKISQNDKQKLDEYMDGIRNIEKRIELTESIPLPPEDFNMPNETPTDVGERIRLLGDMIILAFQTDLTRVFTYMLANEGSNVPYRQININEGHHTLSHHQNDPNKQQKISEINRYHATQVAYILEKMKNTFELDGNSLLDNSMIVYGAGISDGNRHNNENLPIMLAGKGGGSISTGRHITYPEETPLNNLYISMMNNMGIDVDYFGDSTGKLRDL